MVDYLRVVTPYLDSELFSLKSLGEIQKIAKYLPHSSLAGFECRLGESQTKVDFQISVNPHSFKITKEFMESSTWKKILNFFQDLQMSFLLKEQIKRIGLEFDLPNDQPWVLPIPCIFFHLNPLSIDETQALIILILKSLDYEYSSSLQHNLQTCYNSLPNGANIKYVGLMLSRSNQALRIIINGLVNEQLIQYLEKIGWSASTEPLYKLVSQLTLFSDMIALALDVGKTIQPKIGLECFINKSPSEDPRWNLLLDYLVEQRLCTLAKHQAILAWPGICMKSDHPDLWPSNLLWGDRFVNSQGVSVFWRKISHIKLSYHSSLPLEAKAYLAFGHSWLTVITP